MWGSGGGIRSLRALEGERVLTGGKRAGEGVISEGKTGWEWGGVIPCGGNGISGGQGGQVEGVLGVGDGGG